MHNPTTDIQTEFKIDWAIQNKINVTTKYFPHATDGRTDGRTDNDDVNLDFYVRQQSVVFLEKRKTLLKTLA